MTRPIPGCSTHTRRPHAGPSRGLRMTMGTLVVPLVLCVATACSGDAQVAEPEPAPASATPSTVQESATSEPSAPLTTTSRVEKVVGTLEEGGRGRLVESVTPVIDRWWEAAYLGDTWPRTSFGDAFPGFTRGATKEARRDQDLLSNADIGAEVTGVTATRRDVRLDVIAPATRTAGVTARIRLDFETAGEVPHEVSVRGRVFLTRKDGRWRIFGYDVRKVVD